MNIEEKVIELVVEQLEVEPEKITLESSFTDDLGADSLDSMELIMAFEDEFKIEILDEDAKRITTVRRAIEYIKGKIAA